MEVSMTRVSSRGQVVIPRDVREKARLKEGEKLLAYNENGSIVLKRLGSSISQLERLATFGKRFAKQKGIKQKDVLADD